MKNVARGLSKLKLILKSKKGYKSDGRSDHETSAGRFPIGAVEDVEKVEASKIVANATGGLGFSVSK